jgi:SAM-dependent methyltransferase
MSKGRKIWSPYYCLRVFTPNSDHAYIIIGNSFLLSALNFEKPGDNKMFRFICDYLEAPYRFVKNPEKVLVLGAGMGNDVAYALKMGAGHVDAVEIDPVIIELGKKYHPNRPYADGRVTIICNDARTYTRNTRNKYDLIVYGTLDSHGLFSQISSLKMENYVYTLESFRESRRLLKPGGILYVNVGYEALFVRFRLFNCLKEAFGRAPHLYLSQSSLMMYICDETGSTEGENEGEFTYKELKISDEKLRSQIPESYTIPTDDWPHLFLKEKKIPSEYLFALLILFLISAFYVSFYFKLRGSPSVKYFFLGAGFMLLETKSITEMGLVFGSTWIVNSVVIASILLIILMVNLFLLKYEKLRGLYWAYLFLGLALILSYLFPLSCLSISGFAPRLFLAFLYISLPVLFAALIFAVNFREAGEKASFYLASNMLGSVAGGIIEYASMIFGLKALYLCALFVYLVSMLAMIRENRVSASGALKEIPS